MEENKIEETKFELMIIDKSGDYICLDKALNQLDFYSEGVTRIHKNGAIALINFLTKHFEL